MIGYARQADAWRAAGQSVGWRVAELAARRADPLNDTPGFPADLAADTVVVWPRSPSAYALGWADPIRVGLAHHVAVVREEVAQPEGNVFAFGIRSPQGLLRAAIDFDDLSTLAGDPRGFDAYFKMQYARMGYDDERVVPGGYVSKKPSLYDFVDRWRALRANSQQPIDVFARFGLEHGAGVRARMLKLMTSQHEVSFEGGTKRMTWRSHTARLARSKIALDAPGRGEFSYRLVECLALGCCVVGPELANRFPIPLVNGTHEVRVGRDLDGLVETCARLVDDEDLRLEIGRSAERYFDQVLRREQLGAYYLSRCLDRLHETDLTTVLIRRATAAVTEGARSRAAPSRDVG